MATTTVPETQPSFIDTVPATSARAVSCSSSAVAIIDYFIIGPAQFVNGLTIGAIYALVAIGYTMVYGIIELINFAHGDCLHGRRVHRRCTCLTNVLGQDGPIDEPAVLAVVLFVDFAVTMLPAGHPRTAIERFAYRPLRHAPGSPP
jgi:branched-chain amino acid transport system permease protein